MKTLSIRWRLTLWYATAMGTILAVFCLVLLVLTRQQLLAKIDAALREESRELALELQLARNDAELQEHLRLRFFQHDIYDFVVADQTGRVLFTSAGVAPDSPATLVPKMLESASGHFDVHSAGSPPIRMMSERVESPQGTVVAAAITSLAPIEADLRTLQLLMLGLLPVCVVVALAGGYLLAARALAPVQQMVRVADAIDITRLNQRIQVSNPNDELGHLAGTLNSLIGRLERAVEEIQRFTADASHEIRTPLAVLRAEAESALRKPRSSEQYQQSLTTIVDEATHLGRLADQLLNLSRHDAGLTRCRGEHLRVDALIRDVVEQLQPIAAERDITLRTPALEPCETIGDDLQVGHVIFNVIENALKYTLPQGAVSIRCSVVATEILITVKDTGVGIAAEHLPRVFDRFYRVDSSRNIASGGTGLGLAIARAAVQSHGGRIEIDSEVGVGTIVSIHLPDHSRPACISSAAVMCQCE